MLSEKKNAGTLVAEVKMVRNYGAGSILLVEGPSDSKFWASRIVDDCERIVGGGKENVICCIQRLDALRIEGVLGIIDADFDVLLGRDFLSNNLVVTDYSDLECMLIDSVAFERVIGEFGNSNKIKQFETQNNQTILSALIERSLVFGKLRLAAKIFDLDIIGAHISVTRFLEEDSWQIDECSLLSAILPVKGNISISKLRECVAKLSAAETWCVVRGHDILSILRIGLISVLGDNKGNFAIENIARVLRAGYSHDELVLTKLWKDMEQWENGRGCNFQILC